MVLFDLAVLHLSRLSSIAHDSLIFKNIEDESVDGIMQIYNDSKKQIFVAFDRASSYKPSTSRIIYDNTQLELGKDGHELYGENWNVEENNSASKHNKLWKMLIDRGMNKQDLRKLTGLSSASIAKLGKGENVNTDILLKICKAMDCDISDIVEIKKEFT